MVAIANILLLAVAAVAGSASAQTNNLQVGDYFRPAAGDFSGFVGTQAKYSRSPCPALNTLANHGYLNRDGRAITKAQLKAAIMGVYNVDEQVANTLLKNVPADVFNLDALSKHNFIEHDASLVHDDEAFGTDPSIVNMKLVDQLLARAKNGQIGIKQVAAHRKAREAESKATNSAYTLDLKHKFIAYSEAAIFLLGLGDRNTKKISVDHARSFLVNEKIPADYTKASKPIGVVDTIAVVSEIKAVALLPCTK